MTTNDYLRGPWLAVLTDRDGFVYPTVDQARAELDDAAEVTISVVRGSAMPKEDEHDDEVMRAASPYNEGDVAYTVDAYLVDGDDESLSAAARFVQAQHMAEGLNNAGAVARLRVELAALTEVIERVQDVVTAQDGAGRKTVAIHEINRALAAGGEGR